MAAPLSVSSTEEQRAINRVLWSEIHINFQNKITVKYNESVQPHPLQMTTWGKCES